MLLPAWFPGNSLSIALLVFIVAVLLMNKGRWWTLNALAQKEPLAVAIGVFLIVGTAEGWFGQVTPGTQETWFVLGGIALMIGLTARYTEMLDL